MLGFLEGVAMVVRPVGVAVTLDLLTIGLMIWLIIRLLSATGDAVLQNEVLVVEPHSGSR